MSHSLRVEEALSPVVRKARFYDAFFLKLIRDVRDLVFIDLILKITFLVLPLSFLILLLPIKNLGFIFLYWLFSLGVFLGPYILMLHCTSHRPLFKKQYKILNYYIPWVLGLFLGQTPGSYYAHHVGMHHPENNLKDDLSSTLKYRRDSILDFAKYFARFFFFGFFELSYYLYKRGRYKLLTQFLIGEISFYFLTAAIYFWNPLAAFAIFIFPYLITRFMMMNGNWAQHAFVGKDDAGNAYQNSLTCINSAYNRKCFNDGYHIAHHISPTMHYLDVPHHFFNNWQNYEKNNAVIFMKLDYFMIWCLLMMKNYKLLAKYYVDLKPEKRSQTEIAELLRELTRPAFFK